MLSAAEFECVPSNRRLQPEICEDAEFAWLKVLAWSLNLLPALSNAYLPPTAVGMRPKAGNISSGERSS